MAYNDLRRTAVHFPWHKIVWDPIGLPRHNLILWQVFQNCILTQDNLCFRGIITESLCCLCEQHLENVQHLFFQCPYSAYIWSKILAKSGITRQPGNHTQEWNWILSKSRGKSLLSYIFRTSLTSLKGTIYFIWRERNQRKFNNKASTKESTFKRVECSTREQLQINIKKVAISSRNCRICHLWGLTPFFQAPL